MEGRETKQVGGNKSGDQQSSSRYVASAPRPSASDADHTFAGPLMTTKSGFNAFPSNQTPCWPGTDETGSTERHAACGFSIMLERCIAWGHRYGEGVTE